MNPETLAKIRILILFNALFAATRALAEDWPCWRGPRHDGTWKAPILPERWPEIGLVPRWRTPIGGGYSGVVVLGDHVVVSDRLSHPKGTVPDGVERIHCLDAQSGKIRWTHSYPAHYGNLDYGNGPRAAPTIHGGCVFHLGAVGMLSCLDLESGAVRWKHDLAGGFGATIPTWGLSASPIVVGDLVLVHSSVPKGSLMAFEIADGAERWRAVDDPAGYCTPLLIESPSGPQVILWTPRNVHGVDPVTGDDLWAIPYDVTYGVSIATPIHVDGLVFVTGYWEGSKTIQLGVARHSATLKWAENRSLRGLMMPPLHRDGFVYTLDKKFGLTCFEIASGKKRWDDGNRLTPEDRNPQASVIWTLQEDRVLALNAKGDLILARLNPSGYHEQSRANIMGPTWAHPAFAGNCVFARDDQEILCVPLVANP